MLVVLNVVDSKGDYPKMDLNDVCKEWGIDDIGDFSDGFHTFNQLYHQRAILFATIVNCNNRHAWKSL